VLLATNVAARGLDVLSIEQVINYELPESADLFTHRVGRTGRMEREGEAITLLTPEDMPAWQKIQRDLRVKLRIRPWPQDDMPLPALPEITRTTTEERRKGRSTEEGITRPNTKGTERTNVRAGSRRRGDGTADESTRN
jgi:superfamily II DNA/RNA helicase